MTHERRLTAAARLHDDRRVRDHIEFLQAQSLPWRDGAEFGLARRQIKLLSRDTETGAFSCLCRYSADWLEHDRILSVDHEFYVLEGSIRISRTEYGADSYAFLPAGYKCTDIAAREGTAVLSFFSGALATGTAAPLDQRRLVRKIDLTDGKWDGDFDRFGLGSMNDRARMRVLRADPATAENTYITATIPFRHGERAEKHPVAQEFFVLAGELLGNTGTMQAGAYCFRPAMVAHGPYGSRTGALILFRSHSGAQETFWEDAPPFSFKPLHAPVLPPSLAELGAPLPRPPRY